MFFNKNNCIEIFKKHFFHILNIILFLCAIFPIYVPLYQRFTARDSYYSHGFLVPFITIFLIWRKRNILKNMVPYSNIIGLFITVLSLTIFIFSRIFVINVISYLSALTIIFGIILFLFGGKILKEILFPLLFLVFMIPLPSVVIIGIAFKMKMIASHIASFIVNLIGIKNQVAGSKIIYSGGYLLVGDTCSGLRSLISFLCLGTFLVQIIKSSLLKKTILFTSVIPIALLSNALRLITLTVVCYIYGDHLASGLFHDFTGIMVFVIAFTCLMFVIKGLKCQISLETV